MDDISRIALDLIRLDDRVSWVRDQLAVSLSEGITQSAKDRSAVSAPVELSPIAQATSRREKERREKYETSRPYEEDEKVDLIRHALHEVFVAMPEIQMAAIEALREFGAGAKSIEFSDPDVEERPEVIGNHSIDMNAERAKELKRRYEEFERELRR